MTIREAIKVYEGVAAAQSAHSWKTWCKQFDQRWGDRLVSSIGLPEINGLIAERRKEKKSDHTIRSQLNTLRALFKVARKSGAPGVAWPEEDIARLKLRPRLRTYQGDELQRIKATVRPMDFEIIELAFSTGLRKSELWALRRREVDLKSKLIRVVGKGGKLRFVPIGPTAMRVLKMMLKRPGGPYVVNPIGHDRYSRKSSVAIFMRTVWRPALLMCGIEGLVWHSNRHEFASRMARAGKSTQAIQQCGGWSNINQVLIYAHLNNAALHDAVSCI